MVLNAKKCIFFVILGVLSVVNSAQALYTGVSPETFNKMYYLASMSRVDVLREAVGRGLYIDAVNPNGDTGLCIAIKRNNYAAYNSFRMAGANARHACTYRIHEQYQKFLSDNNAEHTEKVLGNSGSLYYAEEEKSWWPWILGGAAVGGGVWALTRHSGGSHHKKKKGGGSSGDDPEIIDGVSGDGLAAYLTNHQHLYESGEGTNSTTVDVVNATADSVVDKIKFLPNMLDNYKYLKTYAKVTDGASYHNLGGGRINLNDATVGLAAHGDKSIIKNDGSINIEAKNGAIGMVASNSATALNAPETGVSPDSSDQGAIRFVFKGSKEGDAVVGMYGDTHGSVVNYGKIIGSTTQAEGSPDSNSSVEIIDSLVGNDDVDTAAATAANSGTMIGMSLFDYYTSEDWSNYTVSAKNYGDISLQAGYNGASNVSISLIGMGSYLDDKFLNGKNNPAFAEQMLLQNDGNINLTYQKTYNLASDALKLGNGGLIGIRADASTGALNRGLINIDMQATTISGGSDVAAGMLSVHGAGLVNGTVGNAYNGGEENTGGTIRMLNEATSGGVFYGMLAAKGSGSQAGLYKWQTPFLRNYGLIDMQVSNSYAMASFAGGEIINDGVINLGVENGQSYYTNNRGMYADGTDVTEEVLLINNGIINVYSEESAAIYNVFSGSVTQTNNGSIYLSNKATNSKVFGGNYSTARNVGDVFYKVGNSASFSFPTGSQDKIGLNVQNPPVASVITASSVGSTTKQYVVNEKTGVMTIGDVRDKEVDYGGTFGTAGIQISKQGSADNKGLITLRQYDHDISQFNTGIWLDSTTTAEAYADNYGSIIVDAPNSIGMRNDSLGGASATNFGKIEVYGEYDYGMAVTQTGANLFNGRYIEEAEDVKTIDVVGEGSVGMYIHNGNVYNYGTIRLLGDHTTAFQLDGPDSKVLVPGTIVWLPGLDDITFYWMTNGASHTFDLGEPIDIDGFTLGKATTDNSGGTAYFSKTSTAYIHGENSHLFVARGAGSGVYNRGTVVVSDGATAMVAESGGSAFNDQRYAVMRVKEGSVGIYGVDSGTTIGTSPVSKIYVEGGSIGLHAEGLASAENSGDISVTDGTGIFLQDGNNTVYTSGKNLGSVAVTGEDNIGVKVTGGAHFANGGDVSAVSGATGIYSDSVVTIENTGGVSVGNNGIGIYHLGSSKDLVNNGSNLSGGGISVTGSNAYGIYGNGINNGDISVDSIDYSAVGVKGSLENNGELSVGKGIGVLGSVENNGEIKVSKGGTGVSGYVVNDGTIEVNDGIGVEGGGINAGSILAKGGVGVKATGSFRNAGEISGNGVVVQVDGGSFQNEGSMSVTTGTAIEVQSGYASNSGTIDVGSGKGFHIISGSGINSGTITLERSGHGAYVEGGSFVNSGTIIFDSSKSGHCANIGVGGECIDNATKDDEGGGSGTTSVSSMPVVLNSGATFVNSGTVDLGDADVDFDESEGQYVLDSGGTYKAASFAGHALASKNIVIEGFEDTYVEEKAFEGENKGLDIASESYMFDASAKDNGDAVDVVLERKNFAELAKEKDLAEFLEVNYQKQNSEKMYRSLKTAATEAEYNAIEESESGKKFYANLPRENMAVVRGIHNMEQKRILEDGVDGGYVSAGYFRTGKDGQGALSDYSDDVYSASLGYGAQIGKNWSIGGGLTAAYADSEYDDVKSSRENKILMAFLPIMYQNSRFKFLSMPSVGFGDGSYTRRTLHNKYEADTFDIYYGIYNHAEYSVDVKIAELVTEADLNLQDIQSDTAKEDGDFKFNSHHTTSMEAGIGVKLRKRIALAKEKELMLAIGTKYYHEFLDPYKDLKIGAKGISQTYPIKGYDENKNRLRTTAEAAYRDGNFVLSAEVAHNAEKEENVEGGVSVRYNFR